MDLRKHSRIPLQLPITLKTKGGSVYTGTTIDISYGGAFIVIADETNSILGDICLLKMKMAKETIAFKCKVTHINELGIGLRFEGITSGSLKNLMMELAQHSPAPKEVLDEIRRNPKHRSQNKR